MMVADPEFEQILYTGNIEEIRLASTKTVNRLQLYSRLMNLQSLHFFCSDIDQFLLDHGQVSGIHCGINLMSPGQIVQHLVNLGLWESFLRKTPAQELIELLESITLPLLDSSVRTDSDQCSHCCNRKFSKTR
jgi:hypothetical protein